MSKLWSYGCSYTAGFIDPNGSVPQPGCNYGDYYVWRGNNFPKIYTELIAEEFNLELVNRAKVATAVIHAFWRLTEDSPKWNPGDIVLYQTTMQERYPMWEEKYKVWTCLGNEIDYPISLKAQEEFKLNRLGTYTAWQRETMACIRGAKALADSKGCTFLAIPFDQNTTYKIFHNKDIYEDIVEHIVHINHQTVRFDGKDLLPTISDETKGEIKDLHYGEYGNKKQAEIISSFLRRFL